MSTAQIIFFIILGGFALLVCFYAAIAFFIRIQYIIGKKKGWWK